MEYFAEKLTEIETDIEKTKNSESPTNHKLGFLEHLKKRLAFIVDHAGEWGGMIYEHTTSISESIDNEINKLKQ